MSGSLAAVLVAAVTFAVASGCNEAGTTSTAKSEPTPAPAANVEPPRGAPVSDEQRAERYAAIKAEYTGTPLGPPEPGGSADSPALAGTVAELRAIMNEAQDVHLRANAAILLGAMLQDHGRWGEAAGAYRQASELVPDDAGPWMALARAEAKQPERMSQAIAAQRRALELDPDNLENFLVMGELLVRDGDKAEATKVYAAYELRRKGLIDGLTLTKDGAYLVSIDERVACAEALAAASDVGTAYALMYALEKDPEPRVRATVATVMGIQRLVGYKEFLAKTLAKETDESVRTAAALALAEIERDPVELPRGPAPGAGEDSPASPPGAPTPTPAPTAKDDAAAPASTDSAAGGTKPPAR